MLTEYKVGIEVKTYQPRVITCMGVVWFIEKLSEFKTKCLDSLECVKSHNQINLDHSF